MNPMDILTFIGAYTHAETSDPNFLYPGQPIYSGGSTSPMRWGSLPPSSGTDNNGDTRIDLLDDFQVQQPREGEDLLLANCHAFDVKVWDDVLGRFIDLGHATTDAGGALIGDMNLRALADTGFPLALDPPAGVNLTGRFQAARHGMGRYGGRAAADNRVFDTWHPAFNFTNDLRPDPDPTPPDIPINRPDNDPPTYRPLWTDRDNFADTFVNGGSDIGFGTPAPAFWLPGDDYAVGDRVFPWPNFPDGTSSPAMPPHMSFFYVCVEAVDGDDDGDITSSTTDQPNWPEAPGTRIEDGCGS
jgi:hypothetical protein